MVALLRTGISRRGAVFGDALGLFDIEAFFPNPIAVKVFPRTLATGWIDVWQPPNWEFPGGRSNTSLKSLVCWMTCNEVQILSQ